MEEIYKYFGVGNLRVNNKSKVCYYSVVKISDIMNIIIPFFDKYPLQTKKRGDFLLWKKAAMLKYNNRKVNLEDLISLKASMNRGLNKNLKERFPLIKAVNRPEFKLDLPLDPNWVAGFVSGDGGFFVNITKKESLKLNYQVRLRFNITQDKIDEVLLKNMITYFNCGTISHSKTMVNYDVFSIKDINEIIVPFFLKYQIRGEKNNNFLKWIKIMELIKNKKHLTIDGLEKIKEIKNTMNSNNLKKFK